MILMKLYLRSRGKKKALAVAKPQIKVYSLVIIGDHHGKIELVVEKIQEKINLKFSMYF